MLSSHINKINASPTMRIAQMAKELLAKGENLIDLSVGEPDFPTPQNIKDAAVKALENDFTKYTINAGTLDLRKAIADKLKKENGIEYSPTEIIVSAGAKQCVYNAINAVVYEGDEVIIPAPYYVSYPEMVKMASGIPLVINTTEVSGFKLTPEQLKNSISPKTKMLILCNPSNPTGTAYGKDDLEKLMEVIAGRDIYILSDEIYEKIIYDNFSFCSVASLGKEIKSKTVIVNGHSKSYSMTGWRLGYAAGPEEIIKAMAKIQSHVTSNASSISQAAGLEALTGPQESVEEMRKEFEKRRNYLYSEISSIKGISCVKPAGAFYLFPNVSGYFKKVNDREIKTSFDLAMYLLEEVKVATVPGNAFGAEGYLRLSYSTSIENLKEAAARLKKGFEKLG